MTTLRPLSPYLYWCISAWVGVWALSGAAQAAPTLTAPPSVLAAQEPVYPTAALQQGVQGEVRLWVDLDDHGAVSRVEVMSSPDGALSEAAQVAIINTQFSPAQSAAGPIAVRIAYTFNFRLPLQPPLAEEQPQVHGRVESEDGSGVANARIRVLPGEVVTRADNTGRFVLALPRAGAYTLEVSHDDVLTTTFPMEAHADETLTITMTVKRLRLTAPYQTIIRTRAPAAEIPVKS